MPLTAKGNEIKGAMEKEYGGKKGEQVFYASRNAGKITGVDAQKMDQIMDSVGKLAERFDSMEKRCDAMGTPSSAKEINAEISDLLKLMRTYRKEGNEQKASEVEKDIKRLESKIRMNGN